MNIRDLGISSYIYYILSKILHPGSEVPSHIYIYIYIIYIGIHMPGSENSYHIYIYIEYISRIGPIYLISIYIYILVYIYIWDITSLKI